MKAISTLTAIDTHTMGEPTRIVTGGIPNIPGKTIAEKKVYFEKQLDYIRKSLMYEPRGHKDMFGAIITNPTNSETDLGIIFMDGGGYLNMCCHGCIGVVTVAVETGMVRVTEPMTYVTLDTPAGLIKAKAMIKDKIVQTITIQNVPSFLYKSDVRIYLSNLKHIKADIAFGGSFFVMINVKELGLKLEVSNIEKLIKIGMEIKKAVNEQIKVQHPEKKHITSIDLVEIYDEPANEEADLKNIVIFGDGQFDRSPCGTGTSAKMATLFAKHELEIGKEFINESIIGTKFRGRLLKEVFVNGLKAVIPEITGNAYITGFNRFVLTPNDPFKFGFIVGNKKNFA